MPEGGRVGPLAWSPLTTFPLTCQQWSRDVEAADTAQAQL